MEWKKLISAVSLGLIVTSGTVGFTYSLQTKKVAPFVKVKRADVGLTGKTELNMAYDFGYKLFSASLERQDMKATGLGMSSPMFLGGEGEFE